MRNVSLEQFYRRIRKKILLVGAYLEEPIISEIIRSCRLKPITCFENNFDLSTCLEHVWVDEFDYQLEIKNHKLIVKKNKQLQKISTDIYKSASIEFIVAHSKKALIGLYPETNHFILLLLGTDNYIRSYKYDGENLNICSPLTVGIKVLKRWFRKRRVKDFQEYLIKSEIKDLIKMKWICAMLPASELCLSTIKNEKLRSIFKNG